VRVSVLRPEELDEGRLAAWARFQDGDPMLASPFLRPEFTRLAALARPDVMAAVVEEDGEPRGFFPFQRRRRSGRPVGGGLSDCQAVVAAPGWDFDARALVRAAGLAVYEFTQMRAGQRPFAPFHRKVVESPVIDLADGGFDAYARGRRAAGRNVVTQTMSHARRLERQLGPLRFVMHDPDPRSLRRLIEWKRRQYQRDRWGGALDVFSHRWAVELLERVHAAQAPGFAGVLSTLWAGDGMVAAHMGMRSPTVLHYWFPAYDGAHAKLAPGRILLLEMIRSAAAAGLRAIELGAGDDGYKDRFANAAIPVAAGFVGPPSLPLWGRRLWHAAGAVARRVPIAPGGRRADELFFRMEWQRNHR
jgi:CelD/BcsL family acetyltransferase involved in cellulose biosynthesis